MRRRQWNLSLQPKLLLGLVMMVAALVIVLTPAISKVYRDQMEEYYTKMAFDQASIAARLIDGDSIQRYYRSGEKDAYYEEVQQYLQTVREEMGLRYFYVVVPEDDVMFYIWDAGIAGEDGVCDLGDTDAYYGGGNELMHAAFAPDAPQVILITDNEEYGYLASAYVAILDSSGQPAALASVDISMDMINGQIRQLVWITLFISFAVLIVSIVAYYFYIRRILIRPLGVLHRATRELVRRKMEDLENFRVDIHTGDELEELSQAFQYMTVELREYIRNLSYVTAEKERIGAELDVAAKIQTHMLPCIFPPFPDRHEFDIYATMTPAKEVGGDFYDFFLVDEDHLAMVIADVSGKGVPAALFMVIAKTLLKNAAQMGQSPREVLEKVNNQLCENNDAEMFVTVWLGIYEISTGRLIAANAGHEYPALYRRDGGFALVKDKHGFVLAGMEGARYREYELTLDPGDTLFVYTDGVPEATDRDNALYGTDRMVAALNTVPGADPEKLLGAVREDLARFVGDAPQFDDITMLAIQRKEMGDGAGHRLQVSPSLESLAQVLEFFEGILTEQGAPTRVIYQVNVAADEIFSNIARYSGATEAQVSCETAEDQVVLRFTDNGRPYDPTKQEEPDTTLSAEERSIGGLGIYMVKKTMDEVSYEYADGRNHLTLVKRWGA